MHPILRFLLRLLVGAAALLFLLSLLVAGLILLLAWLLRAAWARLTGRPAEPFAVRFQMRNGYEAFRRRADRFGSRTPRADALRPPGADPDVIDVEPKSR